MFGILEEAKRNRHGRAPVLHRTRPSQARISRLHVRARTENARTRRQKSLPRLDDEGSGPSSKEDRSHVRTRRHAGDTSSRHAFAGTRRCITGPQRKLKWTHLMPRGVTCCKVICTDDDDDDDDDDDAPGACARTSRARLGPAPWLRPRFGARGPRAFALAGTTPRA
eukprot:3290887-Rhodomonas_salina.2